MKPQRRTARMALLAGLAVMVSIVPVSAAVLWLWLQLDASLIGPVAESLYPHVPVVIVAVLIATVAVAALVAWIFDAYGLSAARIAEEVGIMAESGSLQRLAECGSPEIRSLSKAINKLANARAATLDEIAAQIRAARADSERERNMLAALVEDLAQAVVVCNGDGRILLYNTRAQDMFAGGVGLTGAFMGLGRRLADVVEPGLVDHIRERLSGHLSHYESTAMVSFVTSTAGGRLVRARVRAVPPEHGAANGRLHGFVLLADDITRAAEASARQELVLQSLIQRLRGGLGRIGVLSDALQSEPSQAPAVLQTFRSILLEARELNELVLSTQRDKSEILRAAQPMEDMRLSDLLPAVQRRIEARLGMPSTIDECEAAIWIRVDSFTFMQALSFLITRASETCDVREFRFKATRNGEDAVLDISWSGTALSLETALGWELEAMTLAGESSPLSVREVMERHGAVMAYQRDRAATRSYFRIELPCTEPLEQIEPKLTGGTSGRLEFYDFDLFARSQTSDRLDDVSLADLAYTVFDTETTGPDPSGGDEIIQIGAVRIVNGRLLRGERFEQLVDPNRPIHPESLRIHGITRDRLRGQPGILDVLPRFHAFCADTILVAHNAAFDMRFLQMKQDATGLRFEQPVLDTLLLSVVLHPNQESHRLEAMAERLGVGVVDRHDAFADAMITAQLFLRMIPLLADRGIHTLGEARAASQETFHARITY